MRESLIVNMEIEFRVSMPKVWNLLINPQMTKQYMFGCEVLSDWKVGSTIIWEGLTEDGQKVVYVKGNVTEIEAGRKVTFTMIDPNVGIADIPENYVKLTYELIKIEGGTRLVLTQGDFAKVENGTNRYEESIKGWEMVLPMMKEIVENV